jgi:hypothetical protein
MPVRRAALLAILTSLVALPAAAATLRVPTEYPTINAGLDAAAFGDTVLVAPGLYTTAETRVIDVGGGFPVTCTSLAFLKDGVSLFSESGPGVTVLDLSEAIVVDEAWVLVGGLLPSRDTIIEGFTITGVPNGGTGVRLQDCGLVSVRDCRFLAIDGEDFGGGIECSYSDLEVLGCTFSQCEAQWGGGVYHIIGNLLVEACVFEGCTSQVGVLRVSGDQLQPCEFCIIRDCEFIANAGTEVTGAVYIDASNGYAEVEVTNCRFEGNEVQDGYGAAGIVNGTSGEVLIEGNVFLENHCLGTGGTGGLIAGGLWARILNNTFHRCTHTNPSEVGAALRVGPSGHVVLSNNIFSASAGGPAVHAFLGDLLSSEGCNVFWANEDGDADFFEMDESDRIVDPLFCGPENGDLTLAANSPCLPPNSGGCGLIGALVQGCGGVAIKPMSWARLKVLYR